MLFAIVLTVLVGLAAHTLWLQYRRDIFRRRKDD